MVSEWLAAAGIRAVKTMAQAGLAVLGTGLIGVLDVDWMNVLSVMIMAGIMSLLTSIAGLPEVDGGAPLSEVLDDEETIDHARHVKTLTELKTGVYTDSRNEHPHLVDEDSKELPDQHLEDYV